MKKHLLALFLASQTYLCANYWTSADIIPPGNSIGVQTIVSLAYNPSSSSLMAVWTNTFPHFDVYYANFINGAWTTAQEVIPSPPNLDLSFGDNALIYYGSGPGIQMIAAWGQLNMAISQGKPVYTFYDGTTWSAAQFITLSNVNEHTSDVPALTSFKQNNVLSAMIAWPTNFNFHYYSIYDGSGTLSPLTAHFGVRHVINSTPAPTTGIKLVTIPTANPLYDSIIGAYQDSLSQIPVYVKFDSVTNTWTASSPIDASSTVRIHVNMVYDPTNNRVIAAWITGTSFLPTYSIYDVSTASWSAAANIPLGGSPVPTQGNDVTLAYDPIAHTVFAAWTNNAATVSAFYSILTGTTWTDALPIPHGNSTGAFDDVALGYNVVSQQMYGAWGNFPSPHIPYYTTFSYLPPPVPPTPPSIINPPVNVVVTVRENRFLSQSQICAQLFWVSTLTSTATGYNVYKNGSLIATLPITDNMFTDHNSNRCNVYQVSAFDSDGNESTRVVATLR